jgi:hypothetical protein
MNGRSLFFGLKRGGATAVAPVLCAEAEQAVRNPRGRKASFRK